MDENEISLETVVSIRVQSVENQVRAPSILPIRVW